LSYSLAIGLTRTSTHVEASYACQIPLIDAQGQPVLLVGSNADCAQLGLALTQVGSAADSVRYSPRYAAGLDWKATERDRVSIGVNRQVQPSAGGSTLDARYLQAAWTHDLTHRIAALVTGSQTVSHYTGNAAGHFEFRALSTSLRWQLDRRWSLEAGLGWSQALSGTGTGAPHANSVFLQLRHDFDRQAVSR
jgi:hypothetical protein